MKQSSKQVDLFDVKIEELKEEYGSEFLALEKEGERKYFDSLGRGVETYRARYPEEIDIYKALNSVSEERMVSILSKEIKDRILLSASITGDIFVVIAALRDNANPNYERRVLFGSIP